MGKAVLVKKASGESEPFNHEKFEASLRRSGASEELLSSVSVDIQKWLNEGVTTKQIYSKAFGLLRAKRRSIAARYSLKKALMELGPTGYPFEHFVGQIFEQQGFEVQVGQIIQGHCVQHEVDVVATSNKKQHFVECKYYNTQEKTANVQVSLYVRSRVDDIIRKRSILPEFNNFSFHGWVVTNTRFTPDAMEFGKCSGLNLMSWDYPQSHSLKDIIEKYRFFPITALTELNKKEKQLLMDRGVVLCRQILQNPKVLDPIGFTKAKYTKILEEVADLS
jgi:hypothetical protein